ncbi:MAG TPA: polysaccharide deacetylase family protein [Bryobacteraceae bacterium]|nr:polysaccharide deacetylase family protein [Bryobacteraceae bacterium]
MIRSTAKAIFDRAGGLKCIRWLNRRRLRILMYHRFADRAALARQCEHIRAWYQPVAMHAAADWLEGRAALPPYAVAVTVDDGYRDFLEAGHPIFAEYGIPVTVYLVTDFLDGKSWLWFDRVVQAFLVARVGEAAVEMPGGKALTFTLDSEAARRAAGQRVADLAVSWSAAERSALVERLPRLLRAELPARAPAEFQPLAWDDVRRLAERGVEFGAHTRSHPILSAVADPAELRGEIAGSKARIECELQKPVLHFCYPNGKMPDIGPVVMEAVRAAGMRTAVTAEPGLNTARQDAFLLRRIGTDPGHEQMYFARGLAGLRG